MERQREQDEPGLEQPVAPVRRGRRGRLALIRKTSYTLDELPALIERLRHEEDSPEEAARLRELAERADRWREEMPVVDTPVEEWIAAERERRGVG